MRPFLVPVVFSIACASFLKAQSVECATSVTAADSSWLRQLPWFGNNAFLLNFLQSYHAQQKTSRITDLACGGTVPAQLRIPVRSVIVKRSDSTGSIEAHETDWIIRQMNLTLQANQTSIQFYQICDPIYIYDDVYASDLPSLSTSLGMFSLVDTEGAIDIFFLDSADVGAKGYARFPHDVASFHAWVLTNRPQLGDVSETLLHEMGHCLGLLHTYEGTFCQRFLADPYFNYECGECDQEPVSRTRGQGFPCSNIGALKCSINGDLLCDTPGDPALFENDNLQACAFTPTSNTNGLNWDRWGDTWTPSESNMMSSASGCRTTFSPMQTAVMMGTILNYIPNFYPRVENDFDVFEPNNYPQSATRLQLGDVQCHTFHWSSLAPNEYSACDEDWFRVTLPTYGALEIKTFDVAGQPQPDTYLELFDSSMNLVASNDSLLPGSQFAWIPDINLVPGRYLIRASHRSPNGSAASRGHYHIQANFGPPVHAPEAQSPDLFATLSFDNQAQQVLVQVVRPGTYEFQLSDLHGKPVSWARFSAHAGAQHRLDVPASSSGMFIAVLRQGNSVLHKRFPVLVD